MRVSTSWRWCHFLTNKNNSRKNSPNSMISRSHSHENRFNCNMQNLWLILEIVTFVKRIMKKRLNFTTRWKMGSIIWMRNSLGRSITIWVVVMRIKNSISSHWNALIKRSKSMLNILNWTVVILWKILVPFISEVVCIPMRRLTFNNQLIKEK